MRTRTLSDAERARIVGMREGGMKSSQIAESLKIPRSTVSTVLTKWRVLGQMTTLKPKPRPLKLSDRSMRDLGRMIHSHRRLTLAALAAKFNVHRHTMRRYIRRLGFRSRVAPKKPFLNDTHMNHRLAFAKKYRNWTVDDWKRVIWTDESSFELGKNSRRIRVWRKTHERYSAQCLAPTFKSGRTSVMVWGGFTGFHKSRLVFMPQGERTARDFVNNVYEGELSRFYFMHSEPHKLILMEDGALVHRGKAPAIWRSAHGMQKLDWPANSPDLNPIENLWHIVKDLLRHHQKPKNKEDMIQTIQAVWNDVSLEILQTLIASMPDRIQATIAAKGGSTRW